MIPFACWAHVTHDQPTLLNGILHPLTGWDHMLALLAIGWVALQHSNTRNAFIIPSTFVTGLLLGALIGMLGFAPSFMDSGIASSLVLLGFLVAYSASGKTVWPFALITGVFHGFAHGTETSVTTDAIPYFVGFLSCSIVFMLLGMKVHKRLMSSSALRRIRIAFSGVLMILGTYFLIGSV